VLRYANAIEEFATETDAHVHWANALVGNISLGLDRQGYTPACVWRELRAHQGELRALLEALRRRQPASGPMRVMTAHCGHIRRTLRYGYDPEPTDDLRQKALTSGEVILTGGPPPALWRRIAQWARRLWTPKEPPTYEEFLEPQDPLDPLCEQLRLLCQRGTIEYLGRCEHCYRYYLTRKVRGQRYCDESCKRRANRVPPKKNQQSVTEHRNRKRRDYLRRIKDAKARLRARDPRPGGAAVEVLDVVEVLAEVNKHLKTKISLRRWGISRRRWSALRAYEIKTHGEPRITDLTK